MLFKRFINFLVFSNCWVSLAVTAIAYMVQAQLGSLNFFLLALIFLLNFSAYNFIRIFGALLSNYNPHNERQVWTNKNLKLLVFLSGLSGLSALSLILKLQIYQHPALWIAGTICLMYALPVVSGKRKVRLRDLPFLKIGLIALSWTIIVTWIAIPGFNIFEQPQAIVFSHWLLFMIPYTLPFDIRDMGHDPASLRTIPQTLGLFKTRVLGLVCLMFVELLYWFELILFKNLELIPFIFLMLMLLYTAILLMGATKDKKEMYFSFWIEGAPIIGFIGFFIQSLVS